MFLRTVLILLLLFASALTASAQTERRLALVLANEDYPVEIGRLTNTHEDAAKVEAALRSTGFEVTRVLDADADGLEAAITNFELEINREAADGDRVVAFVYASMHGAAAEVNGRTRNFLLPAREQIASPGQLIRKGLRIDHLVGGLSATDADGVFIVSDACRNSIATSFSKSATKGFVPVNAGPGVLVAFATAPGATTPDDGLFADLLAQEIQIEGRKASFAMFAAVEAVARIRPYDGQPFISPGGLPDWFCFNGCEEPRRAPPPTSLGADEEIISAIIRRDYGMMRRHLELYPESPYIELIDREIFLNNAPKGSGDSDAQGAAAAIPDETDLPPLIRQPSESNSAMGNVVSVLPSNSFINEENHTCRTMEAVFKTNGDETTTFQTLCQNDAGEWYNAD